MSFVSPGAQPSHTNLRYDYDYPGLDYVTAPDSNPVARLRDRLARGEAELALHPRRGYLDAFLAEMGIDASSQVLVYSKTSLQVDRIEPATPRAVYFNDTTYVGFVQGSHLLEIATIDPRLGVMFYTLEPRQSKPVVERESSRCLNCHDTYSMMGGGTPRVVVMSAPVIRPDGRPPGETSVVVTDRTPLSERWGGWYVTGSTSGRPHLGNLPLDDGRRVPVMLATHPGELQSLRDLIDVKPYPTDKSDVVALMVLEHQTYVHSLMSRALYKARTSLMRVAGPDAAPATWGELTPALQKAFLPLVEPLAQALLMEGAARLEAPVKGSAGFEAWFQAQGPRDGQGRSLRDLDLEDRLFRYPVSYLVQGEAFRALPAYLRDYLYTRIARTLQAPDAPGGSPAARQAAYDILLATEPAFAAWVREAGGAGPAADGG